MNTVKMTLFSTVLAAALALMPGPASADCPHKGNPDHKHCDTGGGGGGGDGGPTTDVLYQVDVADNTDFASFAPVYNPACDAFTREQKGPGVLYTAVFERHDLCATVTTSSGERLTDDIEIRVVTNAAGEIVSLQLTGQDIIGKQGIFHESEVIVLGTPVVPSPDGFTIVINLDMVPIYQCDRHTKCGNRLTIIGEVALDLMIYSPVP